MPISSTDTQATGFAADVRDPSSLAKALEQATETLGPIEVLQYSPLPQKDFMRPVLETTPADLVGPVEFSIYGPVAAVHQVVPGMKFLARAGNGNGTILFVNGGTRPRRQGPTSPARASPSPASAPTSRCSTRSSASRASTSRSWSSAARSSEGHKEKDPKVLAETLWNLHDKRDKFRVEVATG